MTSPDSEDRAPEARSDAPPERAGKRPYATPEVFLVGELEEVLLGGTPGSGDSGPNFNIESPLTR